MCSKCIYQRICKLVFIEMNKTAADNPCGHFKEIPPLSDATQNVEDYLA